MIPNDNKDDELDYATLAALRGDDDSDGPLEHVCPLCAPNCRSEVNQKRPTLRTWKPGPGFITYCCARCEATGYAHAIGASEGMLRPPTRTTPPKKQYDLGYVERLWGQASTHLPAEVVGYFRWRGIRLAAVPKGVLRFHPRCPWGQGTQAPCILARYSDAVTGELRGIWRRFYAEKPKTLGPMSGCVIRLYPQIGKRLVIAEGVENALTAGTVLSHRGKPLSPAWAAGSAGNLRRLPVIDGVEQLIIMVDNDESGTGQKAAEECMRRWCDAGREVIRLMPREQGLDFNDLVRP